MSGVSGQRRASNYRVRVVPPRTGVPGRTLRLVLAALVAALGALLLGAAPAGAQQAGLEESEPADGAELDEPPSQIVLRFDAEIGNANLVTVSCGNNPFTALSQPTRSDDNRTLTVEVLEPMPAGTCNVAWTVSEPSGEVGASGRFSFEILTSPISTTPTTVPGTTSEGGGDTEGDDGAGDDGTEDEIADASEVSDGATWLGRVL